MQKTPWPIEIQMLIYICIVGVIYYFLFLRKKKPPTSNTSTQNSTSIASENARQSNRERSSAPALTNSSPKIKFEVIADGVMLDDEEGEEHQDSHVTDDRFKHLHPSNRHPQTAPPITHPEYPRFIFLDWIKHKKAPIEEFPRYFEFELNIKDGERYASTLIRDGLLFKALKPVSPENLTVTELKTILSQIGQKKTGKKVELIERLKNTTLEESLREILGVQELYELSDSGIELLNKYSVFRLFHRHKNWNISIEQYIREGNETNDELAFYKFASNQLKKQYFDAIKHQQWGYSRNLTLSLYELYKCLEDYPNAVEHILGTLLIDISGVSDISSFYLNQELNAELLFMFAPGIIKRIASLKDYISDDILTRVYKIPLPFNLCTYSMFTHIVSEIQTGTLNTEYWQKQLLLKAKAFKKTYKP